MDKLDLLLTKVKREKANAAQGGIDGAYINQFLKDAGSFVTEQKTTLDSADWANSTDAAANKARGEALFDLTSRADMISKYLEANKGAIQKASYNDLKNALRQYTQAFASVRGISENNKAFYSQFDSQEQYDKYIEDQKNKTQKDRWGFTTSDKSPTYTYAISPSEEEDTGLFKAGAFDDGYQFGDVTKTVIGSAGDFLGNAAKGFWGMFEGVSDAILHGASGVADLVGADDVASYLKNEANYETVEKGFAPFLNAVNKNSVLGNTMDSVAQGVGNSAALMLPSGVTQGLGLGEKAASLATTGTTFASGLGSGMSEAYNSGKDVSGLEAFSYGVLKGAVEAGTEALFGGIGKGVNALGISHGIGGVDDMIVTKLTEKLTNQTVKSLIGLGVKSVGEGVEEVLAGFGTAVSKWLTYMSEEDLGKLVEDENLMESFVVGLLSSAISQSPDVVGSIKSGNEVVPEITANEKAVLKAETDARVKAQEEKLGRELTAKEKSDIEKTVRAALEKGYVSTDRIEEVLGGESWKKYREAYDREQSVLKDLKRLLQEKPNIFRKLWNEIEHLATVATGTEEARRLAELQRAFETVYRSETKNPTREGEVKYSLAKIENITPSEEIMEQNIRDVADMKAVHTIDASKLIPGAKSIKDVYNDFFTEWGENIHSDKFGDIAAKSSSVRSDMRHGSTPVKVASIEAIPSVIKNGKIINWFEKNPGLFRITVAAPIKIGNEGYYMGVMLQRDNQSQRLYIHDVIIEEEASDHSQEHLSSTGPDESQKDLFLTNILQKIKKVKKYSVSKETAPSDNTAGWQIKGEDVLLQQEADANGLVWENGVPFRKDLLELARKRQSGEFSIAPPVPESAKGFVGGYSGTTYDTTQAGLLSSVSVEGLQNAADLAGRQDITFNHIGINDQQTKQAWIDADLAYIDTDADGNEIYVVNEAPLLDERDRRHKESAKKTKTVPIAPPVPESAKTETAKSQAAANIAPPAPESAKDTARPADVPIAPPVPGTEKTGKKTEPVAKSKPILAKKDLRSAMYTLFSVPDGQHNAVGAIIDSYADRLIKNGSLTEADRQEFFNRMYESGAMEMAAEDYLAEARSYLKGSGIYVPESVIAEFGDDWNSFRRRAFANGIYLSRTRTSEGHSVAGIDVWNQDLAGELPGLFDVDETDQRSILERIVQVAEEGKAEKLSLAEYTAQLARTENIEETEFLDNMERQMDWALRTFAEKANLEIHLRDRTGKQIAKERQRYRESAERARERKQLSELQQKTLKQLQWLSRNRNRAPEELRSTWDAVLGDIDLFAVGAANEMRWSNKYNATWKDLAQMYKDAEDYDPNFQKSSELEEIVSRIDGTKIADMDFNALQDLYKAAIGIRTEFYNRNNVIQDEQHRLFAEVYSDVKREIESAPGKFKGKKLDKLFNMAQLSPMNVMERMAGWNPDSTFYSMAKQLERGERDVRAYTVKAQRMLQDFLTKHEKWVKKADGQGKDAIWYEVEVPQLLELRMGDKPIFGETVKVYMTPSQKVHMYLESKNLDNLRHMTGGRTFVDKNLYSDGKRKEAFAQGKTVRLAPETVKALVSDLTAEEMELAKVLDQYYNSFAKDEINKVSNILYGYDKAMGKKYAPIYNNENYTKNKYATYDGSAEGVGTMKERKHASNPSYNISALDAFERHVDQTARFCGMAIPTRNWETLMSWTVDRVSTSDVITHKWGDEGKQYITDLINSLQGGGDTKTDGFSSWINKLQSNYISAVFGANPSIVLKQLGSVPMAGAYLGLGNRPSPKQVAKIDRGLISKYTQDLEWRTMGYTTQETKHLKENPNWTQSNKGFRFIFGGDAIVAMDGWAASTLWPWAENKVRKEHPELAVGTQEQINAGESPFYQKVAEEFEEAVSRSQSVSDEIHQSTLRKSKSPLARAFTLFRSDSAQTYNTIRQKIGEARHYMKTGAKKEVVKSAKKAVGTAVLALTENAMWGAGINFLMAMWKNKGKKYRDDEDELTVESVFGQIGADMFGSFAGVVAVGEELAEVIGNIITGDPLYDIDTPGMAQLNDLVETVYKTGENMKDIVASAIKVAQNGGDVSKYFEANLPSILGIVKDIAKDAATYIPGLPAGNLEAYLIGTMKWISPELGKQYDDAFGTGRKKLTEKQQEEFSESGMTIQEYWDYRDALGKLNKQAEKLDYINGMDVDDDTKYVLKWYLFDADKAAEEDPERFEWLENEIGYVEYRELDKDAQQKWSWAYNNQKEYDYMKKNGIRLEDVDVFTVTMTDYNSQKSAVAASLGGAAKYKEYMDEIGDVKGDQDEDGNTISGSVKKNVWAYIDELNLEDGQKYILFKLKYPKDTKYDHKIVGYLRGRKDLTAQKRVDIYNELGIEP